ncbi:MAG: bifunctional non-ous end joining protein LigD [Clostridia bacterium]|nr:bifunctional non-ous end joining protein LigD [Clostridia bacterium]
MIILGDFKLKDKQLVKVNDCIFNITNINKVFWPNEGYTKGDLLNFYTKIASVILPYLKDRPIVMHRYPDGIEGKSFYQKECPEYAPDWLPTVSLPANDGEKLINYCLVKDLPDLLWLVNQGCIEIHPWLSSYKKPDYPFEMVIDLDPNPPADFKQTLLVAKLVKEVLLNYSLRSYAKTSGATGIHIYVPLEPIYKYSEVRKAALKILKIVVEAYPQGATLERKVKERGSRVYLDYLQNVRGKTIASVYSVRPVSGALVSTPLTWEEIEEGNVSPEQFNIKNLDARLSYYGDFFNKVLTDRQRIDNLYDT